MQKLPVQQKPMYFIDCSDPSEYDEIKVGERVFYCKKDRTKNSPIKRRRHSDQFKDPLFKIKDEHRKLRMLSQFADNNDLDSLTEKYRSVVIESSLVLSKEFGIPMAAIYKHYDLKHLGISAEDCGLDDEEEQGNDEYADE